MSGTVVTLDKNVFTASQRVVENRGVQDGRSRVQAAPGGGHLHVAMPDPHQTE